MAHSVGALTMPAPVPGADESADPCLDVLGAFFAAVLTRYVGNLWTAIAPNEPVVRTICAWDPEDTDFSSVRLPALFVWRDGTPKPKRLTDAHEELESTLRVLWVQPNATQAKAARRHSFEAPFERTIALAIIHERDPAWTRDEDTDAASRAYGSDVLALAGLDSWAFQSAQRVPVEIPIAGAKAQLYPGYLATLTICETTTSDPAAFNTSPTVIRGDITDGQTPTLVRQAFRVPKTGT